MQINLADFIKDSAAGTEAAAILRACVHCGFCTATCPTYQLLGDELDGPRGRIYLIKQVLEGQPVTAKTQLHLDRCLSCRNCETTCPSGVRYGRLLDLARPLVEMQVVRPWRIRMLRQVLNTVLPRKWLFTPVMKSGQALRFLLPAKLKDKVPPRQIAGRRPDATQVRKMLLLDGCVQPSMAPNINAATARVFDALGVQLIVASKAGCCGALRHHMNAQQAALNDMRRNIDAWWPYIECVEPQQAVEAIVITASGCGLMLKEYGELLAHDAAYAAKAARVSALARDLSEILEQFAAPLLGKLKNMRGQRIAYHPPCTLQHGQQIRGKVEGLLRAAGVDLVLCADSHLCCGSAGTYSVTQPALSYRLRDSKLANLAATGATTIVSANIGCLTHLQAGTATPVRHWIEVIDQMLSPE